VAEALRARGVPVRLRRLEGGGHDMVIRRRYLQQILAESIAFLEEVDGR
jgi:acetyl esterase/lipase